MSKPKHHIQQEVCGTRPVYREGRKPKAVKVYTVQQESQYLLVQGVPTVGVGRELVELFSSHGTLAEHTHLDSYPAEQFTEVHLLKFERIQSARHAKKRLDNWSFYGGVLHVCYAPEYESVQETRAKLQDRRKTIAAMTRQYCRERTHTSGSAAIQQEPGSNSLDTRSGQPSIPFHHSLHLQGPESSTHSTNNTSQSHFVSHSHDFTRKSKDSRVNDKMHKKTSANYNAKGDHLQQVSNVQKSGMRTSTNSEMNHGEHYNCSEDPFAATQSEVSSVDEQLQLPSPPRESNNYNQKTLSKRQQTYEFARVPTANRTFPAGFDARTNNTPLNSFVAKRSDNESLESDTKVEKDDIKLTQSEPRESDKDKKSSLVIKAFEKKGSVPRFIPRQAQLKKVPSGKELQNGVIPLDSVSQQLKKDAFTLGAVQGAAQPADEVEADPGEMSVKQTMLHVRRQMEEVNKKSSPQIKKRKSSET